MPGLMDDLRQQIEDDRMVVFVGAGVSLTATGGDSTAGWQGLLRNGIKYCVEQQLVKDPGTIASVEQFIESGQTESMIAGAMLIKSWLGGSNGGRYTNWLAGTVGELAPKEPRVIEILASLGLPIVTTNYDLLIEKVTSWAGITWKDGAAWQPVITGTDRQRRLVVHLHGDYLHPESVVLDGGDYAKVLSDASAQLMMQQAAVSKAILFVGFGAGIADPNFSNLRKWLREKLPDSQYNHYRLVPDDEVKAAEAEHAKEGENIRVLPYGARHSDLADFLEKLRPTWTTPNRGVDPGTVVQEPRHILEIEIGGGAVKARATPDLEDAKEDLALDAVRLEMVQILEEWLRQQRDDDPEVSLEATLQRSPREALFLGQILYESVFHDSVRDLYERRRRDERGPLSIILKIRPERADLLNEGTVELTSLPWEMLRSPEGWLSTLPGLTLSRANPDLPTAAWQGPIERLRILVVLVQPRDVLEDMQREWDQEEAHLYPTYRSSIARILVNLRCLRGHEAIESVEWVRAPTMKRFQDALNRADGRPDIVHYIGHGTYDPLRSEGYIALKNLAGNAAWYEYSQFAQQFQVQSPPRMVFLHLCRGPRTSYRVNNLNFVRASFTQLARQVNNSVRLVVAMPYPMSPDVGQQFTERFYQYLRTMTVAEAVQTARRDIVMQQRLGGPLLYMNSDDGLMVPAPRDRAVQRGASQATSAVTVEPHRGGHDRQP